MKKGLKIVLIFGSLLAIAGIVYYFVVFKKTGNILGDTQKRDRRIIIINEKS